MTQDKSTKAYAKSLIKLCIVDGAFSEERAQAVLQVLEENPPRNYAALLKVFLRLAEREVANQTAVVEHAGELSPAAIEAIRNKLSADYGRPIAIRTRPNPDLLAGLRVRVGCDVYETSVAAALNRLQSSLS